MLAVLAAVLLISGLTRLNPEWNANDWLGMALVALGLAAGLAAFIRLIKK
jgi:hypothetical protein